MMGMDAPSFILLSSVFTVSFSGLGNIENIVAAKEQATETAMRNLASEIRAGIVYGI